jgi:hypothetical protein
MINLPHSDKLPIHLLATCFSNKSTTYKFYWFISILQYVEQGKMQISKQELFAQMISNAWYTINYFNVSFGSQDKFQKTILSLRDLENLKINDKKEKVRDILTNTSNQNTIDQLKHFNKNVPHKFLSPWNSSQKRSEVYEFSQDFNHKCPYALYKNHLVINPAWVQYFQLNARILKDF